MFGPGSPLYARERVYQRRILVSHLMASVLLLVSGFVIRVTTEPALPEHIGVIGPTNLSQRIDDNQALVAPTEVEAAGHPLPDAILAIEFDLEETHEADDLPEPTKEGLIEPRPDIPVEETVEGPSVGDGWTGADAAPLAVTSDEIVILEFHRAQYPVDARLMGREGQVLVDVLVGRDGAVKKARPRDGEVLMASMVTAAVDAATRWRFKPIERGGEPLELWVRIPFRYTLD